MQHLVFLPDYKEYLIGMNLYYTNLKASTEKEQQLQQTKLKSKPSLVDLFNQKNNPVSQPDEQQKLLDHLTVVLSAFKQEYNRTTYYESYDITHIEISDVLASEFFGYMLLKRQREITLH